MRYIGTLFLLFFFFPVVSQPATTLPRVFTDLEQAKKMPLQVHHLDLSYQGLTAFPEDILSFPNLTVLNLSGNYLKELPAGLSSLSALREVFLNENAFNHFPEVLLRVEKLRVLEIAGRYENEAIALEDEMGTFPAPKPEQLSVLPEQIGQLHDLQVLIIHTQALSTLPSSFFQLRKLRVLDLSRNNLSYLPEQFAVFQELETLDLSGNQFNGFPEALSSLQNLRHLVLQFYGNDQTGQSGQPAMELPVAIVGMKQLEVLDLYGHQISSLPAAFFELTNLKVLNLGGNPVSLDPEVLCKLSALQLLDLSRPEDPQGSHYMQEEIAKMKGCLANCNIMY